MQIPHKVEFRGLDSSPALSEAIDKRVARLEKVFDRIIGCQVTLESPHHHHHQGARYTAHIRLTVPDKEIVVSHDHGGAAHEDAFVAIRDAFDAAQRQLEDYARVRRGDVKHRSPPPTLTP